MMLLNLLPLLGLALGVGAWFTPASGKTALGLMLAECGAFLLILTGG